MDEQDRDYNNLAQTRSQPPSPQLEDSAFCLCVFTTFLENASDLKNILRCGNKHPNFLSMPRALQVLRLLRSKADEKAKYRIKSWKFWRTVTKGGPFDTRCLSTHKDVFVLFLWLSKNFKPPSNNYPLFPSLIFVWWACTISIFKSDFFARKLRLLPFPKLVQSCSWVQVFASA